MAAVTTQATCAGVTSKQARRGGNPHAPQSAIELGQIDGRSEGGGGSNDELRVYAGRHVVAAANCVRGGSDG